MNIRNVILQGNVLDVLKGIPGNTFHCCVTSPPYWGLRDWGVEGQLGLEKTPEEYVEKMVKVFREVKRVLRNDGTLWLNIGDSYNGSGGAGGDYTKGGLKEGQPKYPGRKVGGLKPKDLCGIPWMLAFALRADGWWLRSDIIWNKPNPMPESVTDRPAKTHEYIFLLTKSQQYFYDADAVREPVSGTANKRQRKNGAPPSMDFKMQKAGQRNRNNESFQSYMNDLPEECGRNRRSVWEIMSQSYHEAHFATFPERLPKICILAGTSAKGVCGECGAPWVRVTEPSDRYGAILGKSFVSHKNDSEMGMKQVRGTNLQNKMRDAGISGREMITIGWEHSCKCSAEVVPAIVLDPFGGSGTTAKVSVDLGRDYVLCELKHEYIALAEKRIASGKPALGLAS